MNNTQKALINQDVCEQTTPNLRITQSSGLDAHSISMGLKPLEACAFPPQGRTISGRDFTIGNLPRALERFFWPALPGPTGDGGQGGTASWQMRFWL